MCRCREVLKSRNIPEKYGVSDNIYKESSEEVKNLRLELYDCYGENEQALWKLMGGTVKVTHISVTGGNWCWVIMNFIK